MIFILCPILLLVISTAPAAPLSLPFFPTLVLNSILFPVRLSFRICVREEFVNLLFAALAIATIRRRFIWLCFVFLCASTWDINKRRSRRRQVAERASSRNGLTLTLLFLFVVRLMRGGDLRRLRRGRRVKY